MAPQSLHLRLDTNAVDCFYQDEELLKLAQNLTQQRKLEFSHTHIVEDELSRISDEEYREALFQRLRDLSTLQPTAGVVADESQVGWARFGTTRRLERATQPRGRRMSRTQLRDIRDALASGSLPVDGIHGWVTNDNDHRKEIERDHKGALVLTCEDLKELLRTL